MFQCHLIWFLACTLKEKKEKKKKSLEKMDTVSVAESLR